MDTYKPLVSVIIPTYNRAHFVTEAIDSVLAQTYLNIEVIVVNDGSRDNTADVLKTYGDRIRLISKPNGGNASARNRGIEESRGDLVAFLDDDDRWLPHKLSVQVPVFEDPDIHLVHTGARFFDESSGWDSTQFIGDVGFHEMLGMKVIYNQTVVVRKHVFKDVGVFAEELGGVGEDWEMWLRVASRFNIRGLNSCTADVRCHDAACHSNLRKVFNGSMTILKKFANVHENCEACRIATRQSRRYLRVYYYEECKKRSSLALKDREYFRAANVRLQAFQYDPTALLLLPFRGMHRLFTR